MILARLTVRCPSNGRSASSTSGLLAPAAQTNVSRASCSCLQWPAVMPWRPHRPYYSHRWPGHPSTHPHPSTAMAMADEPVNPRIVVLPSTWETTAESSLPPCRYLPRPRRRPLPWCSRCGLVNVVNERHPSEVDCTRRD